MAQRHEELDRLYEFGLVLLSILAAAELEYFLAVEKEGMFFFLRSKSLYDSLYNSYSVLVNKRSIPRCNWIKI